MKNSGTSRRSLLLWGAVASTPSWSVANAQQESQELQSGDPDEPKTLLVVDHAAISQLLRIVAFNIKKEAAAVAARTLAVAEEFVGKSQDRNPDMVQEFFGIFGMDARTRSGAFLPFCAAGLSYCAARAYCDYEVPQIIKYNEDNRQMILKEALSDVMHLARTRR